MILDKKESVMKKWPLNRFAGDERSRKEYQDELPKLAGAFQFTYETF